jgi:hypothetical protein
MVQRDETNKKFKYAIRIVVVQFEIEILAGYYMIIKPISNPGPK